jgi:glycosyltransferase involved in cell wall biosynthesis
MRKGIVLVDWHWIGHHPTFFAYFILALEELGADILAICPHPEETRETLAKIRRARGVSPPREGQITYRKMVALRRRFNRKYVSGLCGIPWTLWHFRSIEKLAKDWEAESGRKADLVFYACIYKADFDWFKTVRPFLSLPWSGLYLHATSIRASDDPDHSGRVPNPENIFVGPLCQGVVLLDEGIASQFAAATGKPVVIFPDLTDERLPAQPDEGVLAEGLKQFAGNRPLIGLFGHLIKSKGVLDLALASRDPRMSEVRFAFGGHFNEMWFSPSELDTVKDVLTKGANVWSHLRFIPDGPPLNSLLNACDILSAAYLNFTNSSNIMTKAALLKKPLIVSDGHLMAERVRHFKMGEIVPQEDVEALIGAINKILKSPTAWVAENQPRWPDYLRAHSFERLKESFREILSWTP